MKSSKTYTRKVMNMLNEIVLIVDESGSILDYNNSAGMQLGLDEKKNAKATIRQLISKRQWDDLNKKLETSDEVNEFPLQFKGKESIVIDVEVSARKEHLQSSNYYIIIIAKDVSEAKQKELEYLRFSNAIHYSVNPIQITDNKAVMVYVNPAFATMSGYTEEELIGQNPNLLSSSKQTKEFWSKVWSNLKAGKVWSGELENKRKDGTLIQEEVTISPIVSKKSEVVGFLGVHRDITEQKMLEKHLARAQRLESIGTLAAGVAHEVGNPLTSISSLVQLIQRTTEDEFAKEKLELIKNQINRIAGIIRQLVDFSRPSGQVPVPTDINRVLKDALSIVKFGKKVKDIQFSENFDNTLPKLELVSDQLTQVFLNILINAVDAIGDKPGNIWLESRKREDHIEVIIGDSGQGIREEEIEKIFEPFFTTKDVGQGTGLGLWVSYGIISNLGGNIHVESKIDEGTIFNITLPLR
jgi:PAS domain S-box-containing protein